MKRFLLQALVTALGLWIAAKLISGVEVANVGSLIVAGVFLGIANAVVRPVLVLLTFPITLLTLGLFLIIVNAVVIGLVAGFVPGFHVAGLVPGIQTAVVTGLVSWFVGGLVKDD